MKIEDPKHIDAFFKEHLSDVPITYSEASWNRMEDAINKVTPSSSASNLVSKGVFGKLWVALIPLGIIAGIISWQMINPKQPKLKEESTIVVPKKMDESKNENLKIPEKLIENKEVKPVLRKKTDQQKEKRKKISKKAVVKEKTEEVLEQDTMANRNIFW